MTINFCFSLISFFKLNQNFCRFGLGIDNFIFLFQVIEMCTGET